MKNILMSTAALAGLALVAASPAKAEPALQLGLGGYISGYAVYTDQDEPAGTSYRKFDFRKDTEVHLNGEVALDNGITAGAHLELLADRADGGGTVEESYLYLSSSWGRINFGEEDGIAYLLQVAAPSADDKVDGLRPYIGSFNVGAGTAGGTIGYAQDPFAYTNKFTYITPVFNGFQAGVSYTPTIGADQQGTAAMRADRIAGVAVPGLEDGIELAARYEGSFDAIDLAIGAGYSTADQAVSTPANDDLKAWNVGANVGFGAFGFGAAYLKTNNALSGSNDTDTWVAGIDYTTGPYKLGVSYLNRDIENPGASDTETDRWTAGVIYEWGPGMTFRGAIQHQDTDRPGVGTDGDGTQITLGTQLEF